MNRPCAPGLVSPFNCPAGMQCRPQGRCAGGAVCAEGSPCEGGGACQVTPGSCAVAGGGCTRSQYDQLTVPIEPLPGQAGAVATALMAREPDGLTPMAVAADAALSTLAGRATSHPGRRAALVLATDGMPTGCGNSETVDSVVARLQQGGPRHPHLRRGGVRHGRGGRGPAGARTLRRRGRHAHPVHPDHRRRSGPAAAGGAEGDPWSGRRLRLRPARLAGRHRLHEGQRPHHQPGPDQDLGYVASADRCTDRGGWYYDPPLAAGSKPARLVLCPASCAKLRGDAAAQVDLVFGCATRTID